MMRSRTALLVGVAVLALTGCTGQTPSPDPTATASAWAPASMPQTMWEYADAIVECIRANGWEVTVDPDDPTALTPNIPPGQEDRYIATSDECTAALGPIGNPNPTDEYLQKVYDINTELTQCLADHGYAVADPPSFASFADEVRIDGTIRWDPFAGLKAFNFKAAEKACPRPDYPLH